MRKSVLALASCSIALLGKPAIAGENQSPVSTSSNSTSRYEIIQSEIATKNTFRVDKFCGNVAEIAVDNDGFNHWQEMPIEEQPPCVTDGRPHYQLFTSGIAIRFTYLMNTSSGATWLLVVGDKGKTLWQLLR